MTGVDFDAMQKDDLVAYKTEHDVVVPGWGNLDIDGMRSALRERVNGQEAATTTEAATEAPEPRLPSPPTRAARHRLRHTTTEKIILDDLVVGDNHRALNNEHVDDLVRSLGEVGLISPVTVWRDPETDTNHLVAGGHRVEAARILGWGTIDAAVITNVGDIEREVVTIDENLVRADFTKAERARAMKRRKELFNQLDARRREEQAENKEQETGGKTSPTSLKDGRKAGPQHSKGFAADTEERTGGKVKKRQVNVDIRRAEKIAYDVMEALVEEFPEAADSGRDLDALASVTHEEQRAALKKLRTGDASGVVEALDSMPARSEQLRMRQFERAMGSMTAMTPYLATMDIPHLGSERARQYDDELTAYMRELSVFRSRIREMMTLAEAPAKKGGPEPAVTTAGDRPAV